MAGAHLMLAAELIRAVEQAGGHLAPEALVANVQATLAAVDELMAERPGSHPTSRA